MFVFLLLLSISYWYCLPVLTQSAFGYSEFRSYDVMLLILIVLMTTRYLTVLRTYVAADAVAKWLVRFCAWATLTYPITIVVSQLNDNTEVILTTLVFLFHLWGFSIAYIAFRAFVSSRQRALQMLDVFLIIGIAEGVIIALQSNGTVPRFWSALYDSYGGMSFSGTLGPNRQLPGHMMLLTIGVSVAYWRNRSAVGKVRLSIAAVATLVGLVGLGLSASRTAWTASAVFGTVCLFGRRQQLGVFGLIIVVVASFFVVVPENVRDRMVEIYDWRLTNRLALASPQDDALSRFQNIDAGRSGIWIGGAQTLLERPWLIPFGGGVNNYRQAVANDVSGHNIYLTLIAEVGIIGLFLYLRWVAAVWQTSSSLGATAAKLPEDHTPRFLPTEVRALVIAIMVSLLAGEIVYPYRAAFAFMGSFLQLCALLTSPALVFGAAPETRDAAEEEEAAPAVSTTGLRPLWS